MSEKSSEAPLAREKLEVQKKTSDMITLEAMAKFPMEKEHIKRTVGTAAMRTAPCEYSEDAFSNRKTDALTYLASQSDERKGPTWHCIVGCNFGSFVTHETKQFTYFYVGPCAVLLFKTLTL
ncbi:uncharacterized protein LMH87_007712 [Akanthomyces muscarius]|uniref:Dynein light chain n=1 Tax=Akanthomyces muscarius TaxID=2231603 RepID=A0A9W8QN34_AKAMU|nr:uncharacterized protein LMH87_007712 [Akanthomyces muscarius]KAJ4161688.1 hypothetical protein LMH87_007712 [Akanthomyces muscarius]